jgi:hypothetical protein
MEMSWEEDIVKTKEVEVVKIRGDWVWETVSTKELEE